MGFSVPPFVRSSMVMAPVSRFVCAALLVVGCVSSEPVYRTQKTYQMPVDAQARTQALHCEEVKYECLQLEESRMDRCRLEEDENRDRCWADPDRGPGQKSFYCDRAHENAVRLCDNTYRCTERYDQCFERSGGTIHRTTTCVSNCENAI